MGAAFAVGMATWFYVSVTKLDLKSDSKVNKVTESDDQQE